MIIEYLDEVSPEVCTPKSPVERARMRALMRFIDEMPAAAVRVPTFNLAFLPRFQAMSDEVSGDGGANRCARSSCSPWGARASPRRT